MDTAQVLETYLSDIANLPTDVAYILEELHAKHERLVELQKRVTSRDMSIQKYIKAHGSLVENPRETLAGKISADLQESLALQREKCDLANTGLYIVSRHVKRLNAQIEQLAAEGQVIIPPPVEHVEVPDMPKSSARRASELKRSHSSAQTGIAGRGGASSGGASSTDLASAGSMRPQKRQKTATSASDKAVSSAVLAPSASSASVPAGERSSGASAPASKDPSHSTGPPQEQRSRTGADGRDEEVSYCICQQPSFGTMVGCDNDDCKYEWFHYECVGLTEAPTGTWFCPTCRAK